MSNTASNSSKSTFTLDARVVLNLKKPGHPDKALCFAEDDLYTMTSEVLPDLLDDAPDPSYSSVVRLSDATELVIRRNGGFVELSTINDEAVHRFSLADMRIMARTFDEAEPTFNMVANANEHDEPDFIEDGGRPASC